MENMTDLDAYIQRLLEANPLREPVLRSVIQALRLPAGSHGLDIGCGIGLQELLLAEAVGSEGHVTGMDILPEFLAYGEKLAGQAGLSDRITFQEGDMKHIPFEENAFDWAWSVDCVGYPAGELIPILKEITRVIRPGGSIILLAWSSQQVLPGYPLLEARLNATCSAYLPFLKDKRPEQNFLQTPRWLHEAGLEQVQAQTFVGTVQAPLHPGERTALISLFDMLWGQPQPEVSQGDWKEYQRLCCPGSPDFILDIPGYYAFFTYSMFRGKLPET
jgi:demethylmenaquinone methyltransferase/2-methoxy-6-polyprenyl-1,4-benzoquinol methylase